MLILNLVLDRCMNMEKASIKIIQKQWNGIAKQRSKAILKRKKDFISQYLSIKRSENHIKNR